MKELTVVSRDRVGLLADITESLAAAGVNIESVAVETAARNGVIRLLVSKPDAARKALKDRGFSVADDDVLMLKLADKPGELAKITRLLADSGVAINNVLLVGRENGETLLAVTTSDYPKAKRLLRA